MLRRLASGNGIVTAPFEASRGARTKPSGRAGAADYVRGGRAVLARPPLDPTMELGVRRSAQSLPLMYRWSMYWYCVPARSRSCRRRRWDST